MTWTEADAAEQDVLVDELARCFMEHREECDICTNWRSKQPGATPCPALRIAIDVVLDWRRRRELLSRAEELRLHEQARNAAA